MGELTYARVSGDGREGVPPDFWNVEVFDLDSGSRMDRVVEVNTAEGWLVRFDRETYERERIEGRFELRRRA